MADSLQGIFWIVVFPGFLFTVLLGLVASWIVRKVSALVQWRVGPPFYQPCVDVIKLMGKEILIPQQAHKIVFMAAPLVGLSGVLLLATMLWRTAINPTEFFVGDIIVALYLMILPSLALIFGSSASASPHASLGTSREMKLVMSYELPLVLALIVVIIKTGGQLSLAAIAEQTPALTVSGMLAFLVSLLCVQAKLGFIPFDMAEAETELAGGILMEYSGALLAIWKLMQTIMLIAMPLFLVMVFLGGFGAGLLAGIGKLVLVLVLLILIKNTNPRVRIDQAMKFFWVYCGIALAVAVALAIIGNNYGIAWL
ncbi:MAG TPA: complex I subunit 1 family protein [Sedimentisphaerales bacterium]|nr:complex I subunit 1 family protein [Sedimentisphaerales bacterium]